MGNGDDSFKDGVRQITLSSWQEFHKVVLSLKAKRGYVWRGQKKDWSLQSSFDRKVPSRDQQDRAEKLKAHLNHFKNAMNESFPNVLPPDDIDIWALGQHHGLKTPLLDWTLSPYVAAYFAFAERYDPGDQHDRYRYVYALSRSLERLMAKQKKATKLLSTDRSVPFVDRLRYPSPRFTAQKGIFTKAFQGNDIERYVESFAKKRPSEQIIVRIRIPTKDRSECLCELHLMNIDHTTLLLDLRVAVDYCDEKL